MVDHELVENKAASSPPEISSIRNTVNIPGTDVVRLQTLDLARHVAVDPDEKRYVVATYDDNRVGNGFVTAVYPQQNDYLTLIRLVVYQISSATAEEAIQRHIELVRVIQQGKLHEFLQAHNAYKTGK
ncbi:MAG TPA: hypothetical protein VH593_22860 [Ktedonobacteraceae bacterium]|jgi:hypothetical protein